MDKLTGIISSAELMGGQIVGMRGLKGDKGDTGNGIASIAKTGTSGDIDTYTITFTDGDTTTFNVTNGHTPVITQVPVATDLWTGTAIYVDGVYLTTIMDGAKGDKGDTGATGATGNGIASITLTDTTGSVKTYTITFTNGDTTTFQVTDGEVTNAILEKVLPTDTKSGSIASFPDGTDLFPALSVVADIDPVQDLHGYDAPWVGGSNINKGNFLDGYSINMSGVVEAYSGRCATVDAIPIEPGATYYVKGFGSSYAFIYAVFNGSTLVRRVANVASDTAIDTSGGDKLYVCAYDGTVTNIKPMVVKGSLPSAYSPYSNICPISGWTGCAVDVSGVNLVSSIIPSVNISGSGELVAEPSYSMAVARVKKGQTYTCTTNETTFVGGFFTSAPTQGSTTYNNQRDITFKTFTAPIDGYMVFRIAPTYATAQLNIGSTATDYEPYNGTTYTVSWSGDAGTVYGGTVDLVSGELTVTHGSVNLGSLAWNYNADWNGYGGAFYLANALSGVKLPADNDSYCGAICSQYVEYTRNALRSSANYGFCFPQDGKLSIRDYNYTDAPTFKTAMSGVYLVYPLATPTTYTLTAQQVDLLVGQNTVFADTGDVEVEYKADIQRYIAKKLAE